MKTSIHKFKLFYILIPLAVGVAWYWLGNECEINGLESMLPSKVNLEIFAKVPSGSFYLEGKDYSLSSFYISKTEVTVKEYFSIMGKNPTRYKNDSTYPVVNVSWNNAVMYCNKLSESQKLKPVYTIDAKGNVIGCDFSKNGYRLPTKNEWYYAAIGAEKKYEDKTNTVEYIDKIAWFYYNSNHVPHPVAKKDPNALGIYDLRGNVSEWCNDDAWDWSDTKKMEIKKDFCYFSTSPNPRKAICGGYFDNSAKKLDFLSCQDSCVPSGSSNCYGFRVVRR